MKIIEQIKAPIQSEMEIFEDKFAGYLTSKVALLNRITYFIVKRKGKQMRPMLVFLTAKLLNNGKIGERTYSGASVIELIHTATLVHDDVVDDSNLRRGFFSINALWKNKIAILVGDYLLSKGMLHCINNNYFDLLKIISVAVQDMSEGELLQIEKAKKLDITEEIYFEIIRKKTAVLLASCCAMGARSINANEENVNLFWKFGETIGIAFQIKDDLFDYENNKIGKPVGIDIKEKKMTLPLIYTLNHTDTETRKWVIKTIKKDSKNKKKVKQIIHLVKESGGVDYAKTLMNQYKEKAVGMLSKFPESSYKNALEEMVNYVITRKL